MPNHRTMGQRRRSARNFAILTALESGLSQRDVAELFGISQPQVSAIACDARDRAGLAA